jgi:hypothetical protein
MDTQMISGYTMVGVGFAMLLVNAFSYLFDWGIKTPAFTVLGLVSAVIGLKKARKKPS